MSILTFFPYSDNQSILYIHLSESNDEKKLKSYHLSSNAYHFVHPNNINSSNTNRRFNDKDMKADFFCEPISEKLMRNALLETNNVNYSISDIKHVMHILGLSWM